MSSQLAVRSTPAILVGLFAVRSTQFGGGICHLVRVLQRKQWLYHAPLTPLGSRRRGGGKRQRRLSIFSTVESHNSAVLDDHGEMLATL